ncbi:MAG: MoaD/ThiS family protein [Desulfovibrio sp.]|jgi:sulfur carrier protein ThiS|nr:MoaD/ThiS family protein [Desulfovibrio sp.]MBI4959601.1 MoaD/ThiS family protein [Desulfovibrio sp.]
MLVTVRCLASLVAFQPDPPEMTLPENAQVADVIARLGIPDGAEFMLLLNKGPAGMDSPLRHGSTLELLPIVEGG